VLDDSIFTVHAAGVQLTYAVVFILLEIFPDVVLNVAELSTFSHGVSAELCCCLFCSGELDVGLRDRRVLWYGNFIEFDPNCLVAAFEIVDHL